VRQGIEKGLRSCLSPSPVPATTLALWTSLLSNGASHRSPGSCAGLGAEYTTGPHQRGQVGVSRGRTLTGGMQLLEASPMCTRTHRASVRGQTSEKSVLWEVALQVQGREGRWSSLCTGIHLLVALVQPQSKGPMYRLALGSGVLRRSQGLEGQATQLC
jgi:hypothetical protein